MSNHKVCLYLITQALILVLLIFVVPSANWLAGKLPLTSSFNGLAGSLLLIVFVYIWHKTTREFTFLSPISSWNTFSFLGGIVVLGLLIINILNQPVAGISGLPRSPAQVIDVIIFLAIAEELIFRGVIWSILTSLSQKNIWIMTLVGTSLLFGVMHFGYWAQTGWIFHPEAVFHVISMVFPGAFFGAVRLASCSLAAPVVVHMLANAAILLTQ